MSLPIGGPNRQAFFPSGAPGVPLERESHLATTSSTGLRRFVTGIAHKHGQVLRWSDERERWLRERWLFQRDDDERDSMMMMFSTIFAGD